MKSLIFFGPPGVGKGTQAKLLSKELAIPHISTGDMLRKAVSRKTELGRRAQAIMESGGLVPDDVMVGIVREELMTPGASGGFVLDGFPRTLEQATALSSLLAELGIDDYTVVNFAVDDDEVVKRLSSRLVCDTDGSIYNSLIDDLSVGSKCPRCTGRLIQRDDDREETVRKRLKVYHSTTKPLVEYYSKKGKVLNLNGVGPIAEVQRELRRLVVKEI
ncbi:MAG: adenylate kinase [Ignavibacteria bacterium]|nr:adenylate kinase [Ignavibacteria bacterium]